MQLIPLLILSLAVPIGNATIFGPGGTGGGNIQEADFAQTAHLILHKLKGNSSRSESYLSLDLDDYESALDTTAVECGRGAALRTLRRERKQAYYIAKDGAIYLDCERYDLFKADQNAKFVLVFHEYMRRLDLEGSDYRVSGKLIAALEAEELRPVVRDTPSPQRTDLTGQIGAIGCYRDGFAKWHFEKTPNVGADGMQMYMVRNASGAPGCSPNIFAPESIVSATELYSKLVAVRSINPCEAILSAYDDAWRAANRILPNGKRAGDF